MKQVKQMAVILAAGLALMPGPVTAAADTNSTASNGSDQVKALFGDPVIAKGTGVTIKQSQLDAAVISDRATLAALGRTIPPENALLERRNLLDQLIGVQLVMSKATDADKAAGRDKFQKYLASLKIGMHLTNDEEFNRVLERNLKIQNLTRDDWDKSKIEQATVPLVLERELKTTVTDADVKKFYDSNSAKFEQPEMVRVTHILLSTKDSTDPTQDPTQQRDLAEPQKQAKRKQIDDLLKRARSGEDFTKLAKQYSEDPAVTQNDGAYLLSRMDSFAPEFQTTAFSLTNNQISDVITTVYGYHILKLDEKIPAATLGLDDEVVGTQGNYLMLKRYWKGSADAAPQSAKVSALIKDNLEAQQRQKQVPEYLAKLQKDANVQILDDKLKAVDSTLLAPPPSGAAGKP